MEEMGRAIQRIVEETEGKDPSLPSNCLEGWRCPKCTNQFRFLIECYSVFVMYDDGDDGHSAIEYYETDKAQCPSCELLATVGHFAPHLRQPSIDIRQLTYDDIGRKVRYTPYKGCSVTQCEVGTISSFNAKSVFVLYGRELYPKATLAADLSFVYE